MADKVLGKKKKGGKIALYIIFAALTVFALVLIVSLNNEGGEIFAVLSNAKIGYVFAAIGMLLLYLALSPIALCILTKSRNNKISFGKTYTIGMTEHFFNGITPFATGGQPFQMYAFARSGVKVSESTSLLMMNFLIFMMVTNTYAALALIYFQSFATNTAMVIVAIVGFSINFLVLLSTIIIGTCPFVRRFLMWCVRLGCKIKFLKKFIEPQQAKLEEYFLQVQTAFKDLFKKPLVFLSCLLVRIVNMGVYYAITFFILRALNIDVGFDQLFFIMSGTSFAVTMVVFLPTPGSSGGVELTFAMVFASIIGTGEVANSIAYGGMLIWRLMTYYLAMVISLLFFIGFEIHTNRLRKKTEVQEAVATEDASETAIAEELPEIQTEVCEEPTQEEPEIIAEDNADFANSAGVED